MAHAVREVIGIESAPQAIRDANRNAERNKIHNARFICSNADEIDNLKADIAVIDPPRSGMDADTLEALCAMNPEKIVYISCNSATQARDCAVLCGRGYKALRACAANLFPRTNHVESMVLLCKI
jgi:23S rRNA (uracil1939-C5)-methyltransferase